MQNENVILIDKNADVPKIIRKIKELTLQASKHPEIKQIAAEALKSDNVLKYVFDYSYDRILYVPNEQGTQKLRTVWNFLREGKGNCAIYVTMIGAVLLNLGIPFKYRVVNYIKKNPDTGFIEFPTEMQHVYIVTKDGTVLDPVIGQKQDGTDTRMNRPLNGQFNTELQYYKKIDYPMARLEILQGTIGAANNNFRYMVTNRSKMARSGMLNGTCGCNCGSYNLTPENIETLGRTIFGRILQKTADILVDTVHVVANSIVAPIEAITGEQIVGPNYNTKVASSIDKIGASILETTVPLVVSVGTAGLLNIDAKNPYDVTESERLAEINAQRAFDALNNQPPTTPTQMGGGTIALLVFGSLAAGTLLMNNKNKKGSKVKPKKKK